MKKLLFFALLISSTIRVVAEGTPQIMPNPAIDIRFQVFDNDDPARNFMTYGCPVTSRLNVRVKNVGNERIHIGVKQTNGDVYMRVRDPLGTIVYGPVLVSAAMGAGWINTYAQAVAGPSLVVGAAGYNSLYFTPALPGDYYLEFNPRNANNYIAGTSNVKRLFDFFDVSVENIPTKKIINGRLWSNAWDFNCMSFTNPFEAKMTIYSPDSVLTKIDFNGIQPFGFVILANSTGLSNTASIVNDRRSRAGNIQYPEYKLFIQTPDTTVFVPGRLVPKVLGTPAVVGCSATGWNISLNCTHSGLAEIYFDLNGVPGYQAGTADVFFNNRLTYGQNSIPWNGNNGLGVAVADGTPISMFITYFAGVTHMPLFDCENHVNGYKVSVIAPPGGNPSTFWDDSQLVPVGTSNLAVGCINNCHTWTNRNEQTINTWWVTHYSNLNVLTVKLNDCAPVAVNDFSVTSLNTPITVSVQANDTDPNVDDRPLLTTTILTPPATGTATVVGKNILYTPPAGFSGTVTLTYQICDPAVPAPILCASATVTIVVDCDDDGLSSALEPAGDADGDGLSNKCDLDSDNDGILDSVEGYTDFDGDGIANALDLDSDNDGIADAVEANSGVAPAGYDYTTGRIVGADTDGDGLLNSVDSAPSVGYGTGSTSTLLNPNTDGDSRANYLDKDSDNDGIMDVVECGGVDANRDGVIDGFVDVNGDGINDALLTAPLVVNNTDANGKVDYLDCDSDGDGISDNREGQVSAGFANALAFVDADGDGIANQYDGGLAISPIDTDGDGIPDFKDTDSDNDSVLDIIEGNDANFDGIAGTTPSGLDTDGDGIDNTFDLLPAAFSPNSNLPCQNKDGDTFPDWRDNDDDGDGIATIDETGNTSPANGTPDYLEVAACSVGFTTYGPSGNGLTAIQATATVANPTNAQGAINGTFARLRNTGAALVIQTSSLVLVGQEITLTMRKRAAGVGVCTVEQATASVGPFSALSSYTITTTDPTWSTYTYVITGSSANYFRIIRTAASTVDLEVDALTFSSCQRDFDNDGKPNTVDVDDDNDGILDTAEVGDKDGDGKIDSLDLDSDNDGIPDAVEANNGFLPANMTSNGQYPGSYVKANDSDGDGQANAVDTSTGGTALPDLDTDGDGKKDRVDLDSDNDGIVDAIEANSGVLPANMNTNGQYPTAYAIANDTDGDGLMNAVDINNGGVALLVPDSDGDGVKDYRELDSDGDGLVDALEANNGVLPANMNASGQFPVAYATANDADGDGVMNQFDTFVGTTLVAGPGTAIANTDSDGNGKPDYLDRCLQSTSSGSWNSSSTWGGSPVPTCGKCAIVSHSVTVSGTAYVSNVTILAGGLLTNSTGTFNVCGNLTNSGGTVAVAGCNSKTTLSGTTNQKITGNWTFGTLEINNAAGATLTSGSKADIYKALVLTQGTFSVAATASLSLKSTTLCGNAYVSGTGTGTVTGNATVESSVKGCQGYITIGAPYNLPLNGIGNLYYQGFTGTTYPGYWNNVYTYNEANTGPADSGYVKATNVTNTLPRGKGMVVYTFSNTIPNGVYSKGPVSLAPFTFPLTYNTSSFGNLHDGFNLLANPYPAPIDWGTPTSPGWTKTDCCDAIYSYNRCGNQFSAFVGGISVNGGSGIIPAYQGFWVKAHTPTASIIINRAAIVGTQQTIYKAASVNSIPLSVLNAKITKGVYEDELAVAFGDTAISNGLGSWYGACKMQTGEPGYPTFASWQTMPYDSFLMSINLMPELTANKIVQLKTRIQSAGTYSITFSGLNTFDPNVCIFMEDTLTGIYHDIRQDSVITVAMTTSNYLSNRFVLHFNAPPVVKSIKPACLNSNNGLAIVSSPYSNSTFTWKDNNGVIVKQTTVSGSMPDTLSKLDIGTYHLEITNNNVSAGMCSSASMDIIIPEGNPSLAATFSSTNPSVCNAIDGVIETNVLPLGNYSYQWSNGATTSSITVGDGTYQVKITDDSGCTITDMVSVTGPISTFANYTVSSDTLIWPSSTVNFTNTSFASNSNTWDFGDGNSSTNIDATNTFTAPGTYTVSLTANGTACTDVLSKEIVILSTVGVLNQNAFMDAVSIYPNPSKGEFVIDYMSGKVAAHKIEILDILGQVIYTENINESYKPFKTTIKLNDYEQGIYILRILNNDIKKDLKLILNK